MEQFITFLIALGITAFAYLLIPGILCIARKDLTMSQIKKVVIANGLIVWLVFRVIAFAGGIENYELAPMLLWSGVAYFILKRKCLYEATPYVPKYKAGKTVIVRDDPKDDGANNASNETFSEDRKQLVNLALNVPENKVTLALKLMRTMSESE